MKLLFLTPQPPFPPDQGAKLRNWHLLRLAAEAGHQVSLLTFAPTDHHGLPLPPAAELVERCERVVAVPLPAPRSKLARLTGLLGSDAPDLACRLGSPRFEAALARLLAAERFDVVQAEGFELAPYLRAVVGPRRVLDEHNVEYLLQQRAWQIDRRQPRRAHLAAYSLLQWRRLRRWEARLCRAADAVIAVSAADAAALTALAGRPVSTIPNGVDLSALPHRLPGPIPNPNLLFDGTMSFRPNHDAATWLCQEILPALRARRPELRAWIVGRDPAPSLVRFNLGPYGAAVTGTVDSVEPYWERAGLYVLPMRMGGGVRFKALEAMARGLPLVSTALGMDGTGAQPGRDYLRAETVDEFAAAITRLLDDPALRQQLAASARQTVAALDWPCLAPRLLAIYDDLARSARRLHGGGR